MSHHLRAGAIFVASAACATILGMAGGSTPAMPHRDPPEVQPNDNRIAGGRLDGDTLRIRLVVTRARWRPEADTGPAIDVEAFSEEGAAPRIPAPLIRVREGTVIDATVRNALPDSTITVSGLATRPTAVPDSLILAPGASGRVRFLAGRPGTYFYAATIGVLDSDNSERETASGALIVDPAAGSPPDRVFVINIWGQAVDSLTYRNALAINGRSFPYTERIETTVGDSVRWRWVNASVRPHPMHLHGFYFRLLSRGNTLADSVFAPKAQALEVTEDMRPFTTASLVWSPDRAGNWLFHCHIGYHVVPDTRLDPMLPDAPQHHSGDMTQHMAGLVLAMTARPAPGSASARGEARRIRMFVQEGAPRHRAPRALSFVVQRTEAPPAPDSVEIPASPLILTRGEPTDVTVINRLREATAVHWHGIELESWSDGVAGWSGVGGAVAPAIQPGDSFVARLTLPRAGTFIYHTHLNDWEQLTSGMYGGIVVLEPGDRFDAASDHLYVAGTDGEDRNLLVNGDAVGAPASFRAAVPHRLRLVNIGIANRVRFVLSRDTVPVTWRPIARDGADLPPGLAVERPGTTRLAVGQTADFRWQPEPGEYRLTVLHSDPKVSWSQRITVR